MRMTLFSVTDIVRQFSPIQRIIMVNDTVANRQNTIEIEKKTIMINMQAQPLAERDEQTRR